MPRVKRLQREVSDSVSSTSSTTSTANSDTDLKKYQKLTLREQILLRPDTYIGSIEPVVQSCWVLQREPLAIVQKEIKFIPGLYKIFDEILVNAIDHRTRHPEVSTIQVSMDHATNKIIVHNNGPGIPVEKHPDHGIWIPEMLFGHLLTSTNYDDTEKRTTGGRNGFGSKLTNIFSKHFRVITVCNEKKFDMQWSDNMSKASQVSLTKVKGKDYTQFEFIPDTQKFGIDSISEDTWALFEKRVYDIVACTSGLTVYLNRKKIETKSFEKYIDLYIGPKGDTPRVYEKINDRWELAIAAAEDDHFTQVSFVNGIDTPEGGTHVDYVMDQISKKVAEAITKKNKELDIKPKVVRDQCWLFLRTTIVNPSFSSQTKEKMTLKSGSFDVKCDISDELVKKILKLPIVDKIIQMTMLKERSLLSKTDGKKTNRVSVPKLDDANKAGTVESSKCMLILTEGDSAKTFAVSGLSVIGRDYYGVFPLRGKMLNTRDASIQKILHNSEIQSLKKILGLQENKKYTSLEEIRYGKVIVLSDQDVDGIHIRGLFMNFIQTMWPELIDLGFVCSLATPLVKVKKGKTTQCFYSLEDYNRWKDSTDQTGWGKPKYYKGLGTSTRDEAIEIFQSFHTNLIHYDPDPGTSDSLELAFDKNKTDERKQWILNAVQTKPKTDQSVKKVKYTDFINKELVYFSIADNVRSIPSIMDGLKPSQRKVLCTCFHRNLVREIKVNQLAGAVSETMAYHHGEVSLHGTIVNMAQDFVGSNNLNLLLPNGQFGSRINGGIPAAARYIYTQLNPHTRTIFKPEDDNILKYLEDDGVQIEPEFYLPTIPMVLVNGSSGIGTGFSCTIPQFRISDIVSGVRRLMENPDAEISQLVPYYRGFTGRIDYRGSGKFEIKGMYQIVSDRVLRITELPVGTWTDNYKDYLNSLIDEKVLQSYTEHGTDVKIDFKLTFPPGYLASLTIDVMEKMLKLKTQVNTNNMYLFNANGEIQKYDTPEDILWEWVQERKGYYVKRKEYLQSKLKDELAKLESKVRFINAVIARNPDFDITKMKKTEIESYLSKSGYYPEPEVAKPFDYLLEMRIHTLTPEKADELRETAAKKKHEYELVVAKAPVDFWKEDLVAIKY